MTIPIFSENKVTQRGMSRLPAKAAVSVARLIAYLPAVWIVRVLSIVTKNTRPSPAGIALEARQSVCSVSVRCAGQGCLQRSIAVVILCRLSGFSPDWCTGFNNRPFMAHAWVEVDGLPIGEPDEVRDYAIVLSVRPHQGAV